MEQVGQCDLQSILLGTNQSRTLRNCEMGLSTCRLSFKRRNMLKQFSLPEIGKKNYTDLSDNSIGRKCDLYLGKCAWQTE